MPPPDHKQPGDPDYQTALDPDHPDYDHFLARGKRSTTRQRPDLSDQELVRLAKNNLLNALEGDDPETSQWLVDTLREIANDRRSRQRLPAVRLYAEWMQGRGEEKPTINATHAYVGAQISPKMLEELERQQLEANEAKILEAKIEREGEE